MNPRTDVARERIEIDAVPVTALKGVGPKLQEKLERLGLATIQDVLFHLPLRYQDRTRLTPIGRLRPGREALFSGTVDLADVVYRKRRSLLVRMSDGTGSITLRFFYFNAARQAQFTRGCRLRCFGEVRFGSSGYEVMHPECVVLGEAEPASAEERLTAVYPSTEGVHPQMLRKLVGQALDRYLPDLTDLLPPASPDFPGSGSLGEALDYVHRPPPGADLSLLAEGRHPSQQRLAFEELLAHHLGLRQKRNRAAAERASPIAPRGDMVQRFLGALPFPLTGAQQRVLAEVRTDLARSHPMQRLVQGDVGSGKTVVAAGSVVAAAECGVQSVVMAPTELLADQHALNFSRWLEPLGVRVVSVTGRLKVAERRALLEQVAAGAATVVIGTHALFEHDVEFRHLGLVVVDEQHRFGVQQRLRLREKGARNGVYPHQLIMSATPIPRTLAQSLYADLDVSVVDELPPGRSPVETVALPEERREEIAARVHAACRANRQAYWVCPLIEESDELDAQAAEETFADLRRALPDLKIALVHGRMKPAEKEKTMTAFKEGRVQVLVATTVIEVGVDVPNASLMIIENAERLGLSQLHQLRGRVGRGAQQSHCVLLFSPPLSDAARARLAALRDTNDGFEIARRDMEMRGPGELLGTRQAGMPQFHVADLMRDAALLPRVQAMAERLLVETPERAESIVRRWLGARERYRDV